MPQTTSLNELNKSELYKELNGRTINLHTNLKGKAQKGGDEAGLQPMNL